MHQNAQIATNKADELTLLCEELKPELLIVTEHGFDNSNIMHFKIKNYELASFYCRSNAKGGGVAIFLQNSSNFTPHILTESADKRKSTDKVIILII